MCLYPRLIINRKYTPTIKNKGHVPKIKDERTRFVPVGCGKCMECMKQKAREWKVRLMEEMRVKTVDIKFITLSFSNESLIELEREVNKGQVKAMGYKLDNEIATLAVRRYLERWRWRFKKSQKHWFVTELGQTNTERLHIHGLIWTDEDIKIISEVWKYGKVWVGDYVNERTVNYIVKYINKTDENHKYYKPIVLVSPGMGCNYLKRYDSENNLYQGKDTNEMYKTRQGRKLPLPKYYRNKLYDEEEKEELWINLIDKQERWVNGIKIDISQNEIDYYKVLEEQRIVNKTLGYGDDEKNWDEKQYELNRRNLKRKQRSKDGADGAERPISRIKHNEQIMKELINNFGNNGNSTQI